jgi:hypothetical protein
MIFFKLLVDLGSNVDIGIKINITCLGFPTLFILFMHPVYFQACLAVTPTLSAYNYVHTYLTQIIMCTPGKQFNPFHIQIF